MKGWSVRVTMIMVALPSVVWSARCQNGNETNVLLIWSESHWTNMRISNAIICLIPCVHLNGPFRTRAPWGCHRKRALRRCFMLGWFLCSRNWLSDTCVNEVDKRCPSLLRNLILLRSTGTDQILLKPSWRSCLKCPWILTKNMEKKKKRSESEKSAIIKKRACYSYNSYTTNPP